MAIGLSQLEGEMERRDRMRGEGAEQQRLNRRTVLRAGLAGVGMAVAGPLWLPKVARAANAPVSGGDLVVGVATSYIDVLDPNVTAQTVAHEVMMPMFDTLVYQDRQGKFWPGLAKAWTIAPNGLSYTFTLQSGVTFHDGTPFDAAAVKFNFDRMVASATKSRLAGPRLSGFYQSSQVVDPHTVIIKFQQPNGSFMTDLSQDFMAMLSPAAVQKYGPDGIGQHPVGTGPFKFVEWVQNSHIKVTRNDAYRWASPMFTHQGPAYLNTITYNIIPDNGARTAALQAGEINFDDDVPTIDFISLKNDPSYKTYDIEQPGIPYVYMISTKRPPTDELAVRQAINYAVDKKTIIQTLYQGLYTPAYGPLSPVTFAYNPEVETLYPFSTSKAEQLLESAGWKVGSDGIRVKNGQRLEINHYVFTDTNVAQAMQAQLKTVGIKSNITLLDVGAVNEAATRGEVTNLAPLPFRDADPSVLSVALSIKNVGKGFAWTFHNDHVLDNELTLGQAATDPAQRKVHYFKAQMLAMQDALLIPIYNEAGLQASAARVQNVTFDVKGVDPWTYDIWLSH